MKKEIEAEFRNLRSLISDSNSPLWEEMRSLNGRMNKLEQTGESGAKRQCNCPPPGLPGFTPADAAQCISVDCPIHGQKPKPTPEPDLHARVAKALGEHCEKHGDWLMVDTHYDTQIVHFINGKKWIPIPDYSHDTGLAMGALGEYCQKNKLNAEIRINHFSQYYHVRLWREERPKPYLAPVAIEEELVANLFLPATICLAIVAHAERGKR